MTFSISQPSSVAGKLLLTEGVRQELPTTDGAPAAIQTAAGGAVFVSPEPEPSGAKVWFFTRLGGVSEQPYDSLNVSVKVGDGEDAVTENLRLIQEAMEGRSSAWVRQVAGDGVVRVSTAGFAGEADALATSEMGFSLAIAVADCVPVALAGERGVGMVHSGWRGTLAGVAANAVREMGGAGIRAYIGPCIRGCCYEVSGDLARTFAGRFGEGVVSGRYLSLPAAIRTNLKEAGVEHVHDLGLCSGCRSDLFYSHRKQGPLTGRNLAAVARAPV